jgi:hypothetical protein
MFFGVSGMRRTIPVPGLPRPGASNRGVYIGNGCSPSTLWSYMNRTTKVLGLTLSLLGLQACSTLPHKISSSNPVVGVWLVNDVDAPFPYHMYVFNGDGTMQQANPDAGDPNTSDSDGKGVWIVDGDRIKGKWMEVVADRATHKFAGRTELTLDIRVTQDAFAGTASARSYDANGVLIFGPTPPGRFEGKRVTYP